MNGGGIEQAQKELAASYCGGAAGVLASGLVWIATGLVQARHGVEAAFTTLFFGGMLIQPAAILLPRMLMRAPPLRKGNPLERLGLESTFTLFAGILIGFLLLRDVPHLALPAVALVVGARYFLFRTLYGDALFWGLGAAIAGIGTAAALNVPLVRENAALFVGGVELLFAILLFVRWRPESGN